MKTILLAALLVPMGSRAQFGGGDGRGDVQLAFAGLGQTQFDGGDGRGEIQLAFSGPGLTQFAGGDGRGDVQLAFSNTQNLSQYLGGNGRGDVQLALVGLGQFIFAGGNGRGDVQLAFNNSLALAQFQGGSGRGDVQLGINNTQSLSQYLGGNGRGDVQLAFAGRGQIQFAGGDGRGDVQLAFNNTLGLAQFQGGSGRGDVQLAINNTLSLSQYLGGNGRGDVRLAFNSTLGLSQYMGGNGRGDVALSFTVVVPSQTFLSLKAVLEGPYSSSTGLMGAALRSLPTFPLTEPYTALGYTHVGGGGETVAPAVLANTGSNAIVDWVVVELRDASNPATVMGTRSALLQSDGDVVSVDGVSPVLFNLPSGSYYVAVRHRNHLGTMSQNAVALGLSTTLVDLSVMSTATYGANARRSITGTFPAQALWAGDVTFNHTVQYTGSGNDRDPILVTVGSTTPNNVVSNTYSTRDVNMNGNVQYTGSGNDRDPILLNVGSTAPNNERVEQLP